MNNKITDEEYQKKMNRFQSICYEILLSPITKKNHMQIVTKNGRPFIIPSKQYMEYEENCFPFLRPKPPLPIQDKVQVTCQFYMPTKRTVDLTNLLEAIDDVLVHYGILADDNSKIIVSHDGSRVLYDKEHPRTFIHIERLNEDD